MPIYRRCARCGKRIPSGSRCECIKERYKEYDRAFRDQKSRDFYHSGEWEKVRQYILELDQGVDVYLYKTKGEIRAADTVHHIEPLKDAWDRRFSVPNLMSLHHDTHAYIEKMYKKDKRGMIALLTEMVISYRKERGGAV